MKKSLVLSVLLLLSACTPAIKDTLYDFRLPSELSHCKVITMERGGITSERIHLIKCPEGWIGTSNWKSNGKTSTTNTTYFID